MLGAEGVEPYKKGVTRGVGEEGVIESVALRRRSSARVRPMSRALQYSSRSVALNIAGSSVERVTGMPWRRSLTSGWFTRRECAELS